MQNDPQSPVSVILGVDTHHVHVDAVISQAGKLLSTRIIQTNPTGIWNCLIGLNLLGFSNEPALKEPEPMVPR